MEAYVGNEVGLAAFYESSGLAPIRVACGGSVHDVEGRVRAAIDPLFCVATSGALAGYAYPAPPPRVLDPEAEDDNAEEVENVRTSLRLGASGPYSPVALAAGVGLLPGDPEITANYKVSKKLSRGLMRFAKGFNYRFSSEEERESFIINPAAYVGSHRMPMTPPHIAITGALASGKVRCARNLWANPGAQSSVAAHLSLETSIPVITIEMILKGFAQENTDIGRRVLAGTAEGATIDSATLTDALKEVVSDDVCSRIHLVATTKLCSHL